MKNHQNIKNQQLKHKNIPDPKDFEKEFKNAFKNYSNKTIIIEYKDEIKIKKSSIIREIVKSSLINIPVKIDDIFDGFFILKYNNLVYIKTITDKKFHYIVKSGYEYVEHIYLLENTKEKWILNFKKTAIAYKRLNFWSRYLATNQSKREFKSVINYFNKKNKISKKH